jgi:predicted PurR-regulated permease PerM
MRQSVARSNDDFSEAEHEPVPPRTRIEISVKTLLLIALTVACCWVALRLLTVLLVVVVALFLVGTLNPAVDWLERHKFRRNSAIGLVFGALFATSILIGVLTLPPLVEQLKAIAQHEPELRNRFADVLARSRLTEHFAESLRQVRYEALLRSSLETALMWSTRAVEVVAYLLSSIFLALYVMMDRDRLRGGLYATVPRRYHLRLSRVLLNLETIVGGYIRGQALTSLMMAVVVGVLLAICRVPNALALAMFGGIVDVLPYIGVFLTVGPAAVAASAKGWAVTLVVVGVLLAYEEFESRFLVPNIYGRVLRLPSSIVLIALLVGTALMGIVGALLALPAAAAIRMLIEELRVTLPGERLANSQIRAGDQRAESEYERRARGVPAEEAAAIAIEISNGQREAAGGPKAAAEAALDREHADEHRPSVVPG